MFTLVMLRHGQSEWNLDNLFAGWVDVDLTPRGIREAADAGDLLKMQGYSFDLAYTSFLRRANKTLDIILDRMDLLWIPVEKTWRLNERHYGSLQGLNRVETMARYGEEQYKLWRRSYTGSPPPLPAFSPMRPSLEPRYAQVSAAELPVSESLQDCSARILPYWFVEIVPHILAGSKVLICAHGSTLRAMLKHLKGISDNDIAELNIPTAVPLVLKLDSNLKLIEETYLGDAAQIRAKTEAVASQGRASS